MLGKKTGGRQKGTTNRIMGSVAEMLVARNCNPFEVLADIALGSLQCNVCRLAGRTPVHLKGGKVTDRQCQSCDGRGWEKLSPAERARASETLCKYLQPTLQAVQHSGSIATVDLAAIMRERYGKREITE